MTEPPRSQALGFFTTPPHDCGYLSDRQAVTLFVDPRVRPDKNAYTLLSENGFRRSGAHVYRPKCPSCSACIPIRLAVADFKPRRAQRRNLRLNSALTMQPREAVFDAEHFELYRRYLASRHAGGGMENPAPENYIEFLTANWASTTFYEFRHECELLAVAVVDHLEDGLSAVYTFFDPLCARLSLGRYAILKEIELAQELNLRWLYLGYWIKACQKMSYKSDYGPHQVFVDGAWRDPNTHETQALIDASANRKIEA